MSETVFLLIEYEEAGYGNVRAVRSTLDKAKAFIDSDPALIGAIEIEEHKIDG